MGFFATWAQMKELFHSLDGQYDLYAPVLAAGDERWPDGVVHYGRVTGPEEVLWERRSDYSGKELVMPRVQELFSYGPQGFEPIMPAGRPVLMFARACDINAFLRDDCIYLKNGPRDDIYYANLRERLHFALIECPEPFEGCHCVAMGANKAEGYLFSVAMSGDDGMLLTLESEELLPYFRGFAAAEYEAVFPQRDSSPLPLPDAGAVTTDLFEDEMWRPFDQKCTACGLCNFVCPTCTCFTIEDAADPDRPGEGVRQRVWSGCQADGFTDLAGGFVPRRANGSRLRFKTLHKVYDFPKKFGQMMCVGCGRCDAACPEGISYIGAVRRLAEKTGGGAP